MNRWLTYGAILAAVCGLSGAVLSATSGPVLSRPSPEGVLLPEVTATANLSEEKPERSEEVFEKSTEFRTDAEFDLKLGSLIDPGSFRPVSPGLVISRQEVRPIYQERSDETRPISLALVLDNSWSMIRVNPRTGEPPQDPMYKRLDAATSLLKRLRPKDQVTLGVFPPRRSVLPVDLPPADPALEQVVYRQTPGQVVQALELLRGEENGTTPLYRGIQRAIQIANSAAGARPVVVALTDGKDTEEIPGTFERVLGTIKDAPNTKLYIIALGSGADVPLLRQLTPNVIKVDDSANLDKGFETILKDLSKELVGSHVRLQLKRATQDFAPGESLDVKYRTDGKTLPFTFALPMEAK